MNTPLITFAAATRPGSPRTLATARVLVDECARDKYDGLLGHFGRVDTVESLGLAGTKDPELIDKVAGRYDLLLTRDSRAKSKQDLTIVVRDRIAAGMAENLQMRLRALNEFSPQALQGIFASDLNWTTNVPVLITLRNDLQFDSDVRVANAVLRNQTQIEEQMRQRTACGIELFPNKTARLLHPLDQAMPSIVARALAEELKGRGLEHDLEVRQNVTQAMRYGGLPVSTQVYLAGYLPLLSCPCSQNPFQMLARAMSPA